MKKNIDLYDEVLKYINGFMKLPDRKRTKSIVMQKICLLFYLDPKIFYDELEKLKIEEAIIISFCSHIDLLTTVDEKEIFLMGVSGLYRLSPERL